ncbi:ribosomal protein S18-alanine N-acetyltransferase [Streptococcus merionis]|uniref:ribosomal protein S18-alanine N-acetyltransferase n=1 Tax=Streptococcus merionis TaxID=400065 RepID=UPI003514A6DE
MTTSNGSRLTAEQVFDILNQVYETSPWSMAQIEADMAREDTIYYGVADKDWVGFLALQELAGELEITQIAVLPAYQGQGYASRLMQFLDDRIEPIFLEVRASNAPAIALYQKHKFQKVGCRRAYYHNPVEDALLMMREGRKENE